jgi:tyrosinase
MNSINIRRDAWDLNNEKKWHPVLEWYAVGVKKLRDLDVNLADPRSWTHLAKIHGAPDSEPRPPGVSWNLCHHTCWFFLPWHRVYLHHFEKIVRAAVVGEGGPADWALPYWDYSEPRKRQLPPEFREPLLNGNPNPLYLDQGDRELGDGDLDVHVVDFGPAEREPLFSYVTGGGTVPGFGGPVGSRHRGGTNGTLEVGPHGLVHDAIGGFMGAFETAGLDPIFWLHHCNIDRLWSKWLRIPGHHNPAEGAWLDESFELGLGEWYTNLDVRSILDSRAAPLQYRYQDEPATPALPEVVTEEVALTEAEMPAGPPVMVGATSSEIPLGDSPTHAELDVRAERPQVFETLGVQRPLRAYLKIEHVRAARPSAKSFLVYVNAPEKATPEQLEEHLAGVLPTFGVAESSVDSESQSGEGLTVSFDITDLVQRLEARQAWDNRRLRVTFAPLRPERRDKPPADLRVGRVSLHLG